MEAAVVSTGQQQRSGLGIEAQRAAVERFAEADNIRIIAEYTEAETGKGADALDRRPQLAAREICELQAENAEAAVKRAIREYGIDDQHRQKRLAAYQVL